MIGNLASALRASPRFLGFTVGSIVGSGVACTLGVEVAVGEGVGVGLSPEPKRMEKRIKGVATIPRQLDLFSDFKLKRLNHSIQKAIDLWH